MRTLAEVQKAARAAQILIRLLVDIGGKDGPAEDTAVANATQWFGEMKSTKKKTSSIESGLLRLEQYMDEKTGKGMGIFALYIQVDCT